MTTPTLRNIVAVLIVGGHLCSFVLLAFATMTGGFFTKWLVQIAPIMAPLFALYTAIVLRGLGGATSMPSSRNVGLAFPMIAVVFVGIFSVSIPILILLKASNLISKFEDFRLYVSLIEPACAASVGLIVDILFGSGAEEPGKLGAPIATRKPSSRVKGRS